MKLPSKKTFINYLIDAFTERFIGFIAGMWASGLISLFFETRSFKNLWGLKSHKTLLTKSSYEELEWWVAAIVGFIVYELVNRFFMDKLAKYIPHYGHDQEIPSEPKEPRKPNLPV